MMYGVVKGMNGQILGQHAIDPTAPGGMRAQVARIATERGMAGPPIPNPPPVYAPHAGPSIPMPGVMPAQVFLRFSMRLADGTVREVTRAVHIPESMGIPPGVYRLTFQR